MKDFRDEQVISGTHGELWIEGEQMAEVKGFEAKVEIEKEDIKKARQLATGSKMKGFKCTGTMTLHKVDSSMLERISDSIKAGKNPVFKLLSSLNDPAALGAERIVIKDAKFDTLILANWKVDEIGEQEYPFTFTDWDLKDLIV